jgi:glycosyltransferase involved in cell wall biosynthesis
LSQSSWGNLTVRIAIDGELLRLPPSGIGGYVRNLIRAIQGLDPALDLFTLFPDWDHSVPSNLGRDKPWRDRRFQRLAWEAASVEWAAARQRADLLHVPSFAAPLYARRPIVVTIHDVIPFLLPAYRASRAMRVNLALMRRTVRRAAAVIAPSNAAADDIAGVLGIERAGISVTPEAADPRCQPAPDRAALHDRFAELGIRGRYIFNIGGVDIRKNVPLLIEAFARMRPAMAEPVQLVIAGAPHSDNPAVFPPLAPIVERLGLEGAVILVGRVSEADKLALYQAADLYVTPSAYEGFGLTALEAMACGVPTIAANRTSFPEVVGDGGLLVELDADAIASMMRLVLENPDVARDLSQRGLERAATFSWTRTARQTLDVYRAVLDRST